MKTNNLIISPGRIGLTVFSLGAGQDSEYGFFQIWDKDFQAKYIKNNNLIIVFSHTGQEKERPPNYTSEYLFTYEGLKYLQDYFDQHVYELPFKAYFFVLTHPTTAPKLDKYGIRSITHYYSDLQLFNDSWASIDTNYKKNSTIGMLHSKSRACTLNLKIMPIYRFLDCFIAYHYGFTEDKKRNIIKFAKYHRKIKMLVFFSAEEKSRKHKCSNKCNICPKYKRYGVSMQYPLIDYNLNRQAIQLLIKGIDHPLFIPSACPICHFQTDLQIEFWRRFDLRPLIQMIDLEQAKFHKFRDREVNKGIFGNITVLQKMQKACDKYKYMSDQELKEQILSFSHCIKNSY